jgi:hypothetical protein
MVNNYLTTIDNLFKLSYTIIGRSAMSSPDFDYRNLIRNQLQPDISRKLMAVLFILMLLFIAGLYYYSIHYQNKPQYILPPKSNTANQTFDQVISFIKGDNTDTIPYGEGFNCVDSVWRVKLNARWQGIVAFPVAIQYEEPPGHMVIVFPTTDRGDILIETQNDQQIRLKVGNDYDGRKIRGLYLLDLTPIPIANSPEYEPNMEIK